MSTGKRLGLCSTIIAVLMLAFAGTASASTIGEAYFLYNKRITSIQANCLTTKFIADKGQVSINPYKYKDKLSTVDNGYFEDRIDVQDGFNTADKQKWCYRGDFVYRYYGWHKIQRKSTQTWYCYGMSCQYLYTTTTAWVAHNWS